jgi:hypothetical protein
MILVQETKPKARKKHNCEAYWMVWNTGEMELLDQVKECGGTIKPGQQYVSQTIKDGGELYTWRTCENCHRVAAANELYED